MLNQPRRSISLECSELLYVALCRPLCVLILAIDECTLSFDTTAPVTIDF